MPRPGPRMPNVNTRMPEVLVEQLEAMARALADGNRSVLIQRYVIEGLERDMRKIKRGKVS